MAPYAARTFLPHTECERQTVLLLSGGKVSEKK